MTTDSNRSDKEARPMLGAIRAVTYCVPDLRAIERAYVDELGYRVVTRGYVGAEQARSWGAPASEGLATVLLGPASLEAVYLRFIEDKDAAGWAALKSFGWNVTEFVVADVDALATRLEGGAFEIIGPPKALTRFPMIRAMQTLGPAGECCYFTEVGPGSGLELAAARSFVGRVFIVVAAGPDADALFAPYATFANPIDPPVATPVGVISAAHGLPSDTLHRHGLVRLTQGTLVELDEYPRSAQPRACVEDKLPPGMAIVTFDADAARVRDFTHSRGHSLGEQGFIAPPSACGLPGSGGLSGCLRGAAGELIEIAGTAAGHPPRDDGARQLHDLDPSAPPSDGTR